MSICRMVLNELPNWLASKPQCGDVAYLIDDFLDKRYLYVYRGPDDDPYSHLLSEEFTVDYYMKEINKLKVEEPKMNKRCDNCKYFNSIEMSKVIDNWCSHEKHSGVRVAAHTSCPEHEPKEELTTPLDGVKFYLVNACTGEIGIRYICEDCGKEMKKPFHWWMTVPYGNAVPKNPGLHYRCEECDKKKEGKI